MSEIKSSHLDGKVRHLLLRIYIKQLLPLKLANGLVALLLVYNLWDQANRWLLIGWLALLLLFVAIELYVASRFKRHALAFSTKAWGVMLSVPVVLVGIVWGAALPLFLVLTDPLNFCLITIFLLGMLSGSLYTLSLLPPLFHLYAGMIILPYVFSIYLDPRLWTLVGASLTLAIFYAWLSHHLYRITYDLLLSRYQIKADAHDLKESKRIAERARCAAEQASVAKTRFLASASHDIRQPLQAMALYVEALACRISRQDNIRNLDGLRKSHASMSRIMGALLDISKLDADIIHADIGAVDLQLLISQLVVSFSPLAEKKGLVIRSRVAELYVCSDSVLLERIMLNLMSNALNYTSAGGMLVSCRRKDEMIVLDVWDTGKGMPAAQLENVFLEFYQLDNPERDQQKGMGLGLAIVQRLTRLLPDHSIEVCSREGVGSRFRLTLPEAAPEMVRQHRNHSVAPVEQDDHLHGMQVLVIEDDPAVRQSMESLLQTWGCRVNNAGTISEAVAQMKNGWVPDAVIADYRLPAAETGVQAIQRIRERLQAHIPALVVTGESVPEILRDIQTADDMFLLHKPVLPARLKMFLRRCKINA